MAKKAAAKKKTSKRRGSRRDDRGGSVTHATLKDDNGNDASFVVDNDVLTITDSVGGARRYAIGSDDNGVTLTSEHSGARCSIERDMVRRQHTLTIIDPGTYPGRTTYTGKSDILGS